MLHFYKYHGAGNDFILIDVRNNPIHLSTKQISFLCDRHKGIGADGLMMLLSSNDSDFKMKYYNSDGLEGSMCGNGGRCIISFAFDMGIKKDIYQFTAADGMHRGRILKSVGQNKTIELQMADVHHFIHEKNHFFIDTGSPHDLNFSNHIDEIDVFREGKKIRNSETYSPEGVNVNFIEENNNQLFVRTYERGVENETLACGTGVTAAAIGASIRNNLKYTHYDIRTLGGKLQVRFRSTNGKDFTDIYLTGPAQMVFEGFIHI